MINDNEQTKIEGQSLQISNLVQWMMVICPQNGQQNQITFTMINIHNYRLYILCKKKSTHY